MTSLFKRALNPTKRSVWRGVAAGLLSHYAALVLIIAVRPLIWFIVFGSPHWLSNGPVDPNSVEGTIMQILGVLTWLPSGPAAVLWGGNRGAWAAFAIFAYLGVMSLAAVQRHTIPAMPLARALWYWLSAPIGVTLGLLAYRHWLKNGRARLSAFEEAAQGDA